METGPLVPKLIQCDKKIIVLQGGTASAKTVSALQFLAGVCITEGPVICTVVGQDLPNLKKGAIRDFEVFVANDPTVAPYIKNHNKSEQMWHFKNGSILEFSAYGDEQDAKNGKRHYCFINEGNGIQYGIFWQLQIRTRRKVIIDYNPTTRFWVHDKLLPGEDQDREFKDKVQLYITDHRHNPFLTTEEHQNIENISDPELHRVYARGLTGKITGLVFGHFKKTIDPPATYDRIFWGIDYGYTNDQTALVKIWAKGIQRWAEEICYAPGIPEERIKEYFINAGWIPGQQIYSERDPDIVNGLRRLGLPVGGAIKGPGSKAAGIAKVRSHDCHYLAHSKNFEDELKKYKFMEAEDLYTGKKILINDTVDGHDHCCDAFRMADYTDSFRYRA